MRIITCLLRLLNLFKIDSWKYLLFVASYLYMWICVYLSVGFGYPFGFRVSVRVSGIRGFGFGDGFSPENGFRFGFGFRFRVSVLGARRLHPIWTRPVAILSSSWADSRVKAVVMSERSGATKRWGHSVTKHLLVFPFFFFSFCVCFFRWSVVIWNTGAAAKISSSGSKQVR
jgi:hypothetical protein